MKRYINLYGVLSLAILLGFTSCLNDDNIDDQEYGLINLNAKKIIEIPSSASHEKSLTLLPNGTIDVTLGEVRLAAENPSSEDIVITLSTDPTGIFTEDEAIFPLDQIEVPATVTIPKGERSVPLVVKVNTDYLQGNPQYFPVTIKSVDKSGYTISGNFATLKVNAKVKHKYQGRYVLTGTLSDVASPTLIHPAAPYEDAYKEPYTVQLQTKNGQTLMFFDEILWGDYVYPLATTAGGWSGFGSFCPMFTFDDDDNIIAVTNYHGQPASNTRSAEIDPSGINKYDPATKSFSVSYWMNQSSTVPTPPYHRTHIVETYTFLEDY